jgi:hypothetical protein
MIKQQQIMILSPNIDIYDKVVLKDNVLRKISELIMPGKKIFLWY